MGVSIQEVPLSEILSLEAARTFSQLPDGANPHCFEIATGTLVYFVGEVAGSSAVVSGLGQDVARTWEEAIQQALTPAVSTGVSGSAPSSGHSKSAWPRPPDL